MTHLRLCLLALLASLGLLAAGPASAVTIITTEYTFVGVCADCTGDGIGVLTLENYSLGSPIEMDNFVSFSYKSNVTSFTIDKADLSNIDATLPQSLPSTAFVDIVSSVDGVVFISQTSGVWCTGSDCGADDGGASTWRAGGIPEPSTWAMMLLGFAGLGYAGYWNSRRARVNAQA